MVFAGGWLQLFRIVCIVALLWEEQDAIFYVAFILLAMKCGASEKNMRAERVA